MTKPDDMTPHSPRSMRLDRTIAWSGATSGEFDPGDVFTDLFEHQPTHTRLLAGLSRKFGQPLALKDRPWKWTDYVLDTAVDGFFVEIRMKEPTRRFGYAMLPNLNERLRVERQSEQAVGGKWLEPAEMPLGSLNRKTHQAMVDTMRIIGEVCGHELRTTPRNVIDFFRKPHATAPKP